MSAHTCRFCSNSGLHRFVDLGLTPLSNAFIKEAELNKYEIYYPLTTYICESCFLVQLEQYESPKDIFTEYAYFSSFSDSWLSHAQQYANRMITRMGLHSESRVIELASNDGYLLQYFVERGIPVLGVEPAQNVAMQAVEKGIPTLTEFFGTDIVPAIRSAYGSADLLIGNNVLAHVPNLNDFVAGMQRILSPQGVITMEFPHVYQLIRGNQFDTIYHEHFSYFSFLTAQKVFLDHQLEIFDVEEIFTHGGSLRIFAKHLEDRSKKVTAQVSEMIEQEKEAGLHRLETYLGFADSVALVKRNILKFLIKRKDAGKRIAGYGAPAKGNTLLNYCGIGTDLVDYVVDKNPYKQGLYLPGTRIPIHSPEKIGETKPDYVIIMPWNIQDEVMKQTEYIRQWGGQWVLFIPDVKVIS